MMLRRGHWIIRRLREKRLTTEGLVLCELDKGRVRFVGAVGIGDHRIRRCTLFQQLNQDDGVVVSGVMNGLENH